MSRRDSLRPSGTLAQFTPKQLAKVPERASLTEVARALRMTYDGVYRWTIEGSLIGVQPEPDGVDRPIVVPPLLTHKIETPGGATRVFIAKDELVQWLTATGRIR